MKFAIDRIEENIAILENLETKEKLEVSLNSLPDDIKDGSILIFKNKYILDNNEEEKRRTSIKDKFNRLKKN
ncbi:MAG TPA: hypothetical protein DCE23_02880 [Firmicutes bacterium]|nr:hypothetical protein [Bacillota bacterium]